MSQNQYQLDGVVEMEVNRWLEGKGQDGLMKMEC